MPEIKKPKDRTGSFGNRSNNNKRKFILHNNGLAIILEYYLAGDAPAVVITIGLIVPSGL